MTSEFRGSPALMDCLRQGRLKESRFILTNILQAVGGAQKLVISWLDTASRYCSPSKTENLNPVVVAPTLKGAKKLDHAHFDHPGALRLLWISSGFKPVITVVDKCPTGYDMAV